MGRLSEEFKEQLLGDASKAMAGVSSGIGEAVNGLEKASRALTVANRSGELDDEQYSLLTKQVKKLQTDLSNLSLKLK